MQKWIRDRMRRRKKKTGTDGTPAIDQNPPLQPAYPESSGPGTDDSEDMVVNEAASEPEATAEAEKAAPRKTAAKKAAKKAPRRRKKRKPEQPAVEAAGDDAAQQEAVAVPLTPRGSDHEQPAAEVLPPESAATPIAEEPVAAPPIIEPDPTPATAPEHTAVPTPKKPQRASKGAVILAVGLPGSGKSTWFNRHGVSPLSSDKIRDLLFDNPTEQRHSWRPAPAR
jgi:hypothetical protein